MKIDPRRIREQHKGQRRFRQQPQRPRTRRDLDPPQPLGPDDETGPGKGDRRRQRAGAPRLQRNLRQHDPGDRSERPPLHTAILPIPRSPGQGRTPTRSFAATSLETGSRVVLHSFTDLDELMLAVRPARPCHSCAVIRLPSAVSGWPTVA
jgi:hypothetical protein